MKISGFIAIAAILLFAAGSFYSCKGGNEPDENGIGENESEEILSKEIPFTEYSLTGTNCRWTYVYSDTLLVINSRTEMEQYILCTDGSFPEIDFSKKTLLLASGVMSGSGIGALSVKLLKDTNYVLEIKVTANDATIAAELWRVSLITDKLRVEDKIKLNVEYIKN